ncbi:MAG: NUDIX domain-containing protein [Nanoarchaeota archaeon]
MPDKTYPEPAVSVLVFNPKDEILLFKTDKWKGGYRLPSGQIEMGERAEDAVRRKVHEETGIKDVRDIKFIAWQEMIYDDQFHDKKRHFIFLDFACKTASSVATMSEDAQPCVWVNLYDALRLPIHKYAKKTIEEYIRKESRIVTKNR